MPGGRAHRGAYERALAFCRARKLFARGARVLVGSAGGAASLGAIGFLRLAQDDLALAEVAVGSVDLGGAGDADSVADAGRAARLLGVAFYALTADGGRPVPVLRELAARDGFSVVALGHTRDDAVAHVLAQIGRGVGVSGLRPYVPRRVDGVVRPLLDVGEADAAELARTAGLDPTSMPPDTDARPSLEQRLRRAVLPRLRVEIPGVDTALLSLAAEAKRVTRAVREEALRRLDPVQSDTTCIRVTPVGPDRALASAVARAALSRLELDPRVARAAEDSLARLLRKSTFARERREVVLGPGLVAAYAPEQSVVTVRVMKLRRSTDEGIG